MTKTFLPGTTANCSLLKIFFSGAPSNIILLYKDPLKYFETYLIMRYIQTGRGKIPVWGFRGFKDINIKYRFINFKLFLTGLREMSLKDYLSAVQRKVYAC